MTSSRFDPGSTSICPQKPWTSPFYGSMNGPGLKTLCLTRHELSCQILTHLHLGKTSINHKCQSHIRAEPKELIVNHPKLPLSAPPNAPEGAQTQCKLIKSKWCWSLIQSIDYLCWHIGSHTFLKMYISLINKVVLIMVLHYW